MKNFNGKKILITGGASGIGKLMAEKLASRMATVIVVDINLEAAKTLVSNIKSTGGKAHAVYADLSKIESIKKCRQEILDLGINIDILINNAGVVFGGEFEMQPLEKHLLTYNINVDGVIAMTHLFFGDLKLSKDANIVNIASASGYIGLPFGTTYASSKWAVIGFSESLRLELIERGIRNIHVTTVCPSYINTGMFSGVKAPLFLPWLRPEDIVEKIIQGIERNYAFVKEPFMVKWIDLFKGVLPLRLFIAINKFLGVSTSMANWKGRS